ncbi:hypothetical protein CALCODRAFT_326863 [Calocera cornea HHB12733]|uniref:Uncharacterized protein n=1 Tax=Calocera cornea HHB12733 TaxID=1353952 RepID=A0A165JGN1_9BASI|nr:hypothetical protein CALCODRAFT_326863 [Calocera cornea HHB12733]
MGRAIPARIWKRCGKHAREAGRSVRRSQGKRGRAITPAHDSRARHYDSTSAENGWHAACRGTRPHAREASDGGERKVRPAREPGRTRGKRILPPANRRNMAATSVSEPAGARRVMRRPGKAQRTGEEGGWPPIGRASPGAWVQQRARPQGRPRGVRAYSQRGRPPPRVLPQLPQARFNSRRQY